MKSFWKSEATGCTELVSGLLPERRIASLFQKLFVPTLSPTV
jgi:hypothetical protein